MRSAGILRTTALLLIVLCANLGAAEARHTALDRSKIRYPLPSSPPPAPSASLSPPSPYGAPYTPPSLSPFFPSPSAYAASPPAYGSLPPPISTYEPSPAVCGLSYFSSYIDDTGSDAPDGNYKESCADISYNSSTDTVTAECGSNPKLQDTTLFSSGPTTLHGACQCTTNIANNNGFLECVLASAMTPSAPASDDCPPLLALYKSKLDKTGGASPDGNYKETCGKISYNCQTDTVSASCASSQEAIHQDPQTYVRTSFTGASACAGHLGNDAGSLVCLV